MKFSYTDLYRPSYLRWPRRHYFSRGTRGKACSNTCRHSAFRRISSKFSCSPHRRSDRESTYSSSPTDYYSDTSSFSSYSDTDYYSDTSICSSSYSSGYDSYTSTEKSSNSVSDTEDDLNTFVTDIESSYYLTDTEGGSNTAADESSSFDSHTECETNTSTDNGSYTLAASSGDSYTTAYESSYTLCDSENDGYDSKVHRDYRADFHTSTADSSYNTGKSTTLESSERSSSPSTDTSESTKSESSEKSLYSTTRFSTAEYYNRRHGLKRFSSGRKCRSSMNDSPATSVSRKYNPSSSRRLYSSKRRTSYCACAGDQNKKRRRFDS